MHYHLDFAASSLSHEMLSRARVIAAALLLSPYDLRRPEHMAARSRIVVRDHDGGHQARSSDDARLQVWAPSVDDAREVLFALLQALARIEKSVPLPRPTVLEGSPPASSASPQRSDRALRRSG